MKIRFGVGLGADTGPDQLAGDRRPLWKPPALIRCGSPSSSTPRRSTRSSAWLMRWPGPESEGRHFGRRASRAAIPYWSPSSWPRWRGWRQNGCCRCSACGRRSRPNATSSWCRTASAPRCSTNRCNCCDPFWSRTMSPSHGDFFSVNSAWSPRVRPSRSTSGSAAPRLPRSAASAGFGRRLARQLPDPDEAADGREPIERAAAEAGREIEPDHFGINVAVSDGGLSEAAGRRGQAAQARRRSDRTRRRQLGAAARTARRLHGRRADQVRHSARDPERFDDFIDRFVAELFPRQN